MLEGKNEAIQSYIVSKPPRVEHTARRGGSSSLPLEDEAAYIGRIIGEAVNCLALRWGLSFGLSELPRNLDELSLHASAPRNDVMNETVNVVERNDIQPEAPLQGI